MTDQVSQRDAYLAAWPTMPTRAEVWHALIVAAATDDPTPIAEVEHRAALATIGPKWSDPANDRRPVARITHRAEQGPRRTPTATDPTSAAWTAACHELRYLTLSGDDMAAHTLHKRMQRHGTPAAHLMHHETAPECARLTDPLAPTGDQTIAVTPAWSVDSTHQATRTYVPTNPNQHGDFFRARGWQGAPLTPERTGVNAARDRERDARLLSEAVAIVRGWQRGGPIPRRLGSGERVTAASLARDTIGQLLDEGGRDADPAAAARIAQRLLTARRAAAVG